MLSPNIPKLVPFIVQNHRQFLLLVTFWSKDGKTMPDASNN